MKNESKHESKLPAIFFIIGAWFLFYAAYVAVVEVVEFIISLF